MTKSDDYLWDRSGPPDPEVARLEELLSPLRHDAPLDEVRLRRRRSRVPVIAGALVAVAAAVTLIAWWRWPEGEAQIACTGSAGFTFTARGGTVVCGGDDLAAGVLPVGGVLDTGSHEAELAIADIGRAQLGAGTRVRLDQTSKTKHQLYLERGHMHAHVTAPPRLFAVATPSAHVTDLGCEYALDIDARGAGSIHVLTGKVELATESGAIVVAPAGTHARLLPGRKPSLPLVDGAAAQIEEAVAAYDRSAPDAIDRILAAATPADAVTVANLAELATTADRRRIVERLFALAPPPPGATVDELLRDRSLYDLWFSRVILDQMMRSLPTK